MRSLISARGSDVTTKFPAELRRARVAHIGCGVANVVTQAQEHCCLVESKGLDELQVGAVRGGLELFVKGSATHAVALGEIIHRDVLARVLLQIGDGAAPLHCGAVSVAHGGTGLTA